MATYDKNDKATAQAQPTQQAQSQQQTQPQSGSTPFNQAQTEAAWNAQVAAEQRQTAHDELNAGLNQQQQQQNTFQQAFGQNNGSTPSAQNIISGMADLLYKPFNKGALNERATRVLEIFKDFYNETKVADPTTLRVDFIPAPAGKISHPYGGIIVALPIKGPAGKIQIVSHLVIVETTASILPTNIHFNNLKIPFPNTGSSTVSKNTSLGVEKLVRQYYHGETQDFTYINGNYTVIPSELSLDDRSVLYRIEEYAISAAYTLLQLYNIDTVEDEGIGFAKAAAADTVQWTASIEEKPINQTDVTGSLIRTDFSIKTTMEAVQQSANQQYEDSLLEFGEVNAYCTPVFAQPENMMAPNGMIVPSTSRHYFNRIVVKDFRTGPRVRMSIGSALMLLATTSALSVNGVWKRAYFPNRHIDPNQTDIHDIGAIGYEAPLLNPINHPQNMPVQQTPGPVTLKHEMIATKTAEFTNDRFNQLMDAAFHPEVLYSIDVLDGHYLLALFLAEAQGNVNARSIIGKTLNTMTSGGFYSIFHPDAPMFETSGERVINGYYPNSTLGVLRPLDDVDHLAMLNITSGELEWIRNWEMFDVQGNHQDLRVARRYEILQRFAMDKAVVKSYSTRVNILPEFMQALVTSLAKAKLYPHVNSQLVQADSYVRATANQFSKLAIGPMNIPNAFVQQNNGFNQWGNQSTSAYVANPWG